MKGFKYILIVLTLIISLSACFKQPSSAMLPGRYEDFTLLPNGWKLSPAGQPVSIGEFPLNLLVTPDEQLAFTCNSGMGENSISLIDLKQKKEIQRLIVNKTWRGLAFDSKRKQLYVSGGNDDLVLTFALQNNHLAPKDTLFLRDKEAKQPLSVSALAFNQKKNELYVVTRESNQFIAVDVSNKQIIKEISLPGKCYDILIDNQRQTAYVSIWEKAQIIPVNLDALSKAAPISVGEHPSEMVITMDGSRLFVANANNNSVSVVDLPSGKISETLIASIKENAPYGSTPNALALNSDASVLFIANADNNALCLFNIAEPGHAHSLGFIPLGWYPTSVRYLSKSRKILVTNGKGSGSMANPDGPKPGQKMSQKTKQYIGNLFKGMLLIIAEPNAAKLAEYTQQVYRNTPYATPKKTKSVNQKIIPSTHNGQRSNTIRHVFYIIKENRTYDQVLGDLRQGNGDSSLCLFPGRVTPNAHELARQFVLFDNFYADAEVSADGHNWSTAAYATDYVEKTWPVLYGRRGGKYDFEGGVPIAIPSSGYIWDAVLKKGLQLRNYGEFTPGKKNKHGVYSSREEKLQPYTCPQYPGFNLTISDVTRYKIWANDFDSLLAIDRVPDFSLIRLPNDHTAGTQKGLPTIASMIADNDYALGLIVEHISNSALWKNSIIFVLEDDAQNGSDHVDAHRSLLFVIGPYIKRNFVAHTMYSTSSVLKTIELILGLQPMTQFDLSATPILSVVSEQADFRPYRAILPQVDLMQINDGTAYGAARCAQMNLLTEDAIPDVEFNEIIWKALRGVQSSMPAPVRSAFVRIHKENEAREGND